jgi:hypothetical protein
MTDFLVWLVFLGVPWVIAIAAVCYPRLWLVSLGVLVTGSVIVFGVLEVFPLAVVFVALPHLGLVLMFVGLVVEGSRRWGTGRRSEGEETGRQDGSSAWENWLKSPR